ncbi:protein disulfide isomerase [Neoconidiobolus thromboides FSU 785]|nr:protein disulfide isomerase [Neoconidiobolus thromboides FSU 785]
MKFLNQIAYTLLFAAGFRGEEAKVSDVLDLNKENYASTLKAEKLILVEYFAPWCGHCKALAPEYELAATALKEHNIKIAKVDCTVEQDICQEEGIQGYPSLKVFSDGNASSYGGQRKSDAIVSFMKKQALPAVSELKADEFEKFSTSDRVVLIGFVEEGSKERKVLDELAKKHRNDFLFGAVSDKKVAKKEGASKNGFVLYKQFDEGKNVYDGKVNEEDLLEFIKTNSIPLIDEIGPSNFATYMDSKKPIAYIFVDKVEDRETYDKDLKDLAKETKGKINFVFLNATLYGRHAESINLKEEFPAFGIQQIEPAGKFPLDGVKELNAKAITKFVKEFLAGDLKPSIKSAAAPEKNDGPVKVIVSDEFDQIVNEADKDVLVEFYAPWCGHCKKLEPIYKELGEAYADKKNIVIAKMDVIDNDLPYGAKFEVNGFPTIKLFKAGKDKEIVEYEGDRTLEDLAKFLAENAVNDAKVELKKSEESAEEEDSSEKAEEEEKDEL